MPMNYTLDHQRMMILSRGHGVVKADEMCVYYDRLGNDSELPAGYNILCDLTKVENFDINYETISAVVRSVLNARKIKKTPKVAFLAHRDIQYGIANMYAAMGLLHGGDFNVFREELDATAWLVE